MKLVMEGIKKEGDKGRNREEELRDQERTVSREASYVRKQNRWEEERDGMNKLLEGKEVVIDEGKS